MKKNDIILILGAKGMVGSAIARELFSIGYSNISTPNRSELDLMNQKQTNKYIGNLKPDVIFDAAAKVGGIQANNNYRADFIFQNLTIQNNIFGAAFDAKVQNLLFLGSSCIYPRECPQPIKEEYLLTGELEPTNEPYAIAKIAGLKSAEYFKQQYGLNWYSAMPTNLYGEHDNFHCENSHVIPGLIARMDKAIKAGEPTFEIWGSGLPRREFLYVDDMAKACIFLMESGVQLPGSHINIGTGEDIEIGKLAALIAKLMGFQGQLIQNTKYPDGMMKKLLDITRIKDLGWKPEVTLEEGLKRSIEFFRSSAEVRCQ